MSIAFCCISTGEFHFPNKDAANIAINTVESFLNKKENLELIPKDLPVLIFAGDKDPVGDFGKGIKRLYECYKELGIHDLKYKLYKNGRHEMLNESNKDEVILDILNWTNRIVKVNEKVTN